VTDALPLDQLLPRLRARAADADRRTSSRPSELMAGVRTLDLGGLLTMGRSLADQLRGVVAANQEGRVDQAGLEAAMGLERAMTTAAPSVLPGPADEAWLAQVEARLGVPLPPALRRVYAEVADGGFGPGEGLLPLAHLADKYEELRSPGMMPRGRAWPEGLLPLVSMDPGWDCVEAATGRVIAWDPEDLSERSSEAVFARSFREIHPSVEAWLTDWVGSKTQEEVMAAQRASMQANAAYIHIRNLQSSTPEQLAQFGLTDGWEARMAAGMGAPWPPPHDVD
jgi:hypothetical protein